jgi:alpha-tubulin suppressor-like RCC1 family protein
LGDASLSTRHAGAPVSVVGGHTFVRIDAGLDHTCAVDQESVAWCWGDASGAVGVSGDPVLEPTRVSADLRFTDVSAGRSQSCGVTAEGDVYCWGIKGWLGAGGAYSVDASGPVRALLDEPVVQISSDFSHTCARTSPGVAYCWGFSYAGEVGADLDGGVTTPVRVVGDHSWAWVDGGHVLTCGLTTDGRGWCWGRGNFGRMGTGVEVGDVFAPTPVAGGHIFTAIDAGATHTCALDAEGQAWCWGYNDRGQLGIAAGDPGSDCSVFDCVHAPVAVDTDVRFTSVQPGDRLTCGVTTDQELVCWGLRERLGSGREIIEDEY